MQTLYDLLSYAVFTGFAFAAVCAMTRGGRGWPWRLVALGVLIAVDVTVERLWSVGEMPLDRWLAVCFLGKCGVCAALIFVLSHDSLGRRLFLSIVYGGYAVCFAVVFHLFAYRNVFGLTDAGCAAVGLSSVVFLNLLLLFWVLPSMPRDGRVFRWGEPCLVAGMVAVLLYVSGIWPISVVTAPPRGCSAFAVAAVVAWVAFPVLCRLMRERLRTAAAEQSVALMTAEMRERRAAIDEARRLRHDQRFHRVQLGEYLLSGQPDKALAYLRELDAEAAETQADKLVWCENETVNAILSGAFRKATAKGVSFVIEAHLERTIPLPDVELVAVFANVIDNALEACGNEVTCTIRQRTFGIGITVTNPVPEGFVLSDRGLPCAEPGVGMESIRRVVERHDGQWTYEVKDGLLTCQVILMFG